MNIGQTLDSKAASTKCYPFILNKDLGKNTSWSGKTLDPEAIASPCGYKGKLLVNTAFMVFNDTFKLKYHSASGVVDKVINQKGISKYQGTGIDFKSRNPSQEWINPADQHFIIWMQTQSLMTKKKLWGRIQQNLPAGNYSVVAENNYQINNMRITKGVQIIESSIFGGKSLIIPIIFLLFTLACVAFVIVLQKKFKDLDNLTFARQSILIRGHKKK